MVMLYSETVARSNSHSLSLSIFHPLPSLLLALFGVVFQQIDTLLIFENFEWIKCPVFPKSDWFYLIVSLVT